TFGFRQVFDYQRKKKSRGLTLGFGMTGEMGPVLAGTYDYRFVIVSIAIAISASYAALDLAGRVADSRGVTRTLWLSGGATAMGLGIWSMHYVGMLAFSLPVPVEYDWP